MLKHFFFFDYPNPGDIYVRKNQKVPLGLLAGTHAQSWTEILCYDSHNWHVYWCVLTGNAVLRDVLATVKGEMKGEVI